MKGKEKIQSPFGGGGERCLFIYLLPFPPTSYHQLLAPSHYSFLGKSETEKGPL